MSSPRKIREEMLPCGYRKCCPVVQIFDDGNAILTDDDIDGGSVGTIKLRPEQYARLVELGKK